MEALLDDIKEDLFLLKRHIEVLKTVSKHQPIGIISISRKLKLTPAQTRYSLRVLQSKNLINPSVTGATTDFKWETYQKNWTQKKKELLLVVKKI